MLFTAQQIAYRHTEKFTKIILEYLDGAETLRPFYEAPPTWAGMEAALKKKETHLISREKLVQVLHEQYAAVDAAEAVEQNIDALLAPNTFTVCTAHQPDLFTGPLFFIYKILHAVKLATELCQRFPAYRFLPVYYMGSEDADKEELLHLYSGGRRYDWQTAQTGAVGRMQIDATIADLINELAGQWEAFPHGTAVVALLRNYFTKGKTLQAATFELVHALFKKWGLVVLIADHALLKKLMLPVFEADLFHQTPSAVVAEACRQLAEHYDVQAQPRDINLFYLKNGIRNRILKQGAGFAVNDTDIRFTDAEMQEELTAHPERFSPNVILRGLFQETILPNIAFIGGGGELAYWLQLKPLFQQYSVPFPVLVLRNSFLLIEKKWQQRIEKLALTNEALFKPLLQLVNHVLDRQGLLPQLKSEQTQLQNVYGDLKKLAGTVDVTLVQHVAALETRTLQQVATLEKKLARAERRKHDVLQNQVAQLKEQLFPKNGLQERVENFGLFYAKWGPVFLDDLLKHSPGLEQQFTILAET